MRRSNRAVAGMEVLVSGYGRIGAFLAGMLTGLGAHVTVAARSEAARAAARLHGCGAVDFAHIPPVFDAVVNTVPAPVLAGDYGGGLGLGRAGAESPGPAGALCSQGRGRRDGGGHISCDRGGRRPWKINCAWGWP